MLQRVMVVVAPHMWQGFIRKALEQFAIEYATDEADGDEDDDEGEESEEEEEEEESECFLTCVHMRVVAPLGTCIR